MIRLSHIIFWFALTIGASLMLYHTSDRVHVLDQELRTVNAQIEDEQRSLHVLKAEWVYLANPSRLEETARKYLPLRPTATRQVVKLDALATALPPRDDSVATNVSVSGTPIASLKMLAAMLPPRPAAPKSAHAAQSAADTSHVNERMIMRTASAAPITGMSGDIIGALIATTGPHP